MLSSYDLLARHGNKSLKSYMNMTIYIGHYAPQCKA